jgi:hypothetical protein
MSNPILKKRFLLELNKRLKFDVRKPKIDWPSDPSWYGGPLMYVSSAIEAFVAATRKPRRRKVPPRKS